MINLEINNRNVQANEGETILQVLNRENINVPTLCHMKNMLPSGACRICVVEEEKWGKLIPSCSFPVMEGMKIKTQSPRVIESRKTIVELLLSDHPDDCLYCVRNTNCELQTLASEYDVRERRISGKKSELYKDLSSMSIERDPAKCILCGRCVRMCEEIIGVSAIDFINRGSKTVVGCTFNDGLNTSSCVNCGQCILVCPTGALTERGYLERVTTALNDPKKYVVATYAPSISLALGEEFGIAPGTDVNGLMNAALRKMGFERVFDTTFTADLTIMEESAELIHRITNNGVLPMFTSCCPGWVKYVEEFHPDLLPNVSTCKSPQQMMGAVVKSYFAATEGINPADIVVVAIMPCTAKKFEASREEMTSEGMADIDIGLTTREFAKLIRKHGIDINNIKAEDADSPLGSRSTAGKLFAATGGVMEAAIRTAYFKITGNEMPDLNVEAVRGLDGIKEAHLQVGDLNVGVAVVNGLGNAPKLIQDIKENKRNVHFVEVMACPGGCLCGGGQPIGATPEALQARAKALYAIDRDEKETLKTSHQNKDIIALYEKFLGEPLGHKSHELLHTHYQKRDVLL